MSERFVIAREQGGERVDKVLARLLPTVSRASIQRWVKEERVTVNGVACRASDRLNVGDDVLLDRGPPPASEALPDPDVEVDVVFEDTDLVVVNKPAGLVVHPGRGHTTGTLVNGLLARPGFGRAPSDPLDPDGALRPGIVHRIDKDTSGLLVVAKTASAREGLKAQLAEHSVDRVYQGLTLGIPVSGRVETLHGRHPTSRLKFTSDVRHGRLAITVVTVVERVARKRAALVECRLHTGRTHQIRVHLAEQLGCPLFADALYGRKSGAEDLRDVELRLRRHALHARVLGFTHPRTGERHLFTQELPEDLSGALRALDGPATRS